MPQGTEHKKIQKNDLPSTTHKINGRVRLKAKHEVNLVPRSLARQPDAQGSRPHGCNSNFQLLPCCRYHHATAAAAVVVFPPLTKSVHRAAVGYARLLLLPLLHYCLCWTICLRFPIFFTEFRPVCQLLIQC